MRVDREKNKGGGADKWERRGRDGEGSDEVRTVDANSCISLVFKLSASKFLVMCKNGKAQRKCGCDIYS